MPEQNGIFRSVGMFLLHSIFSIVGPAIIDASLHNLIPAHSGTGIVLKAWIGSIAGAFLIALLMVRALQSRTALWVWIVRALGLAMGFVAWYGSHHGSLFEDTLLGRFSGNTCAITLDHRPCRDFLLFTIPFVRAAAYSVGSLLSLVVRRSSNPPVVRDVQEGASA